MAPQRRWSPEEAARREAEYVRLIAAADAATRRMALRLEAVRSANRHRHAQQPVDAAPGPQHTAAPEGDADHAPRRRRLAEGVLILWCALHAQLRREGGRGSNP